MCVSVCVSVCVCVCGGSVCAHSKYMHSLSVLFTQQFSCELCSLATELNAAINSSFANTNIRTYVCTEY